MRFMNLIKNIRDRKMKRYMAAMVILNIMASMLLLIGCEKKFDWYVKDDFQCTPTPEQLGEKK